MGISQFKYTATTTLYLSPVPEGDGTKSKVSLVTALPVGGVSPSPKLPGDLTLKMLETLRHILL